MVTLLWCRTAYASLPLLLLLVVSHPYVSPHSSVVLSSLLTRACVYTTPRTPPQAHKSREREGKEEETHPKRDAQEGADEHPEATSQHTSHTKRKARESATAQEKEGNTQERARESATAQEKEGKGKRQQRERAARDRARLRHGRHCGRKHPQHRVREQRAHTQVVESTSPYTKRTHTP